MPRSTKAVPKAAVTNRRATKRGASEQPVCYEIPESPCSPEATRGQSTCVRPPDNSFAPNPAISPTLHVRHRSNSTASSTVVDDSDATPVQLKARRPRSISTEPEKVTYPGLEAIEAVNGLYTKMKNCQAELETILQEKEILSTQVHNLEACVSALQVEIKQEKDKTRKLASVQNKEADAARVEAEEQLKIAISSLQSFSSAALRIMPLLDVLTGAADIEYDDATEKLYQIVKRYKAVPGGNIDTKLRAQVTE